MRFFLLVLVTGLISSTFLFTIPVNEVMGATVSEYQERSFSKETIEHFKNDPDFKYARPPKYNPLKTELMGRIALWLAALFSHVPGSVLKLLPYLLATIVILITVIYIRKVTFTGALGKQSTQISQSEIFEENIHTIDFDKAIHEAVATGEFRLATRLYFLLTLKVMHDRKLILHSREKTNRDYLHELRNVPIKNDFRWLITSFEFVWYGNTQPGAVLFQNVQQRYTDFLKLLERTKA